ncbi:MAG: tRNA lysidine(34) synthetase TilS [Bacteroidota bacterium]
MDADQVQFPLKLRSWQKGDKMQPFGMHNHQLLSDVFIQQKRRPEEKTNAIIVEDARQIVCVSGFRLAEGVKITDKTQRMLKLSCFVHWEEG